MLVSTFNERDPRSLFIVYLTHGHNKRVGGQQSWVANAIRSEKKIIYKSKLWWSNWELLMWSCRPSFARVISLEHSVQTTLRGGCNEASLAKTCELVYLLHKCTWTGQRHQSITICPFFFIVPPLFRKDCYSWTGAKESYSTLFRIIKFLQFHVSSLISPTNRNEVGS